MAGVPPDYFSAQGQLWGNPVYNWDKLRQTGYRWCIDRLRALLAHVDVVRLDHFRAFSAAWHIPAGSPTAQSGSWEPGPGADFFNAVKRELGGLPFIAEDLGYITPDVHALRDQFQILGRASCNLPSTAIPITRTCLTTTLEHSGIHRHPRQSSKPLLVRRVAGRPAAELVALPELSATR